jgi:hypothetical protein
LPKRDILSTRLALVLSESSVDWGIWIGTVAGEGKLSNNTSGIVEAAGAGLGEEPGRVGKRMGSSLTGAAAGGFSFRFTRNTSTSKMRVALGGIAPGAPF